MDVGRIMNKKISIDKRAQGRRDINPRCT